MYERISLEEAVYDYHQAYHDYMRKIKTAEKDFQHDTEVFITILQKINEGE